MITEMRCDECNARYASDTDSCATRFDRLLALDHSRREPWGSRHGQAFAAFALQHPRRFAASLDSAWAALYRIYCLEQPSVQVFAAIRAAGGRSVADSAVPARPALPGTFPSVTIADLGDFPAPDYPSQLDAWCRATLHAWGAPINVATA